MPLILKFLSLLCDKRTLKRGYSRWKLTYIYLFLGAGLINDTLLFYTKVISGSKTHWKCVIFGRNQPAKLCESRRLWIKFQLRQEANKYKTKQQKYHRKLWTNTYYIKPKIIKCSTQLINKIQNKPKKSKYKSTG